MNDISLDIEAVGDVLLSIGACRFDISTGESIGDLYLTFSDKAVQAQLDKGLRVEGETLLWWFGKDRADGRAALFDGVPFDSVPAAIDQLRQMTWKGTDGNYARVWAYPTSYDLSRIERVGRAFRVKVPWKWTETMDARTLWNLALVVDPALKMVERQSPVRHHALEDAKEQARWIARYYAAVMGAAIPATSPKGDHDAIPALRAMEEALVREGMAIGRGNEPSLESANVLHSAGIIGDCADRLEQKMRFEQAAIEKGREP